TRLVVSIAAILAAAGMLVYFYVALSAIAPVATRTVPHLIGGLSPQSWLRTSTLLIAFGLTLLGVEAVTTLNSRVSSVSRPIGSAMAGIALAGAMRWVLLSSRPALSWPSTSTTWCCWPRIYLRRPAASG